MSLEIMTTSSKTLVTSETLWGMPRRDRNYELVRGELIEKPLTGALHGYIVANVGSLVGGFVATQKLGETMIKTGYVLTTQPDTVLGPDVSFLSNDRIPKDGLPEGFISGAPDLAVEVISSDDTASEIQNKTQIYLVSGVRLIWLVYPQQRLIIVHYPDGTAKTLQAQDTLSGEEVIPGFTCRVVDIFS